METINTKYTEDEPEVQTYGCLLNNFQNSGLGHPMNADIYRPPTAGNQKLVATAHA